jgi:hypothetical protein
MNALVHIVDHANKHFEANRLGWRDVISSAMICLLTMTLQGLQPCVMMVTNQCNVSITSTRIGNSCSLDAQPTFGSGMGSRVTKKLKGATT